MKFFCTYEDNFYRSKFKKDEKSNKRRAAETKPKIIKETARKLDFKKAETFITEKTSGYTQN